MQSSQSALPSEQHAPRKEEFVVRMAKFTEEQEKTMNEYTVFLYQVCGGLKYALEGDSKKIDVAEVSRTIESPSKRAGIVVMTSYFPAHFAEIRHLSRVSETDYIGEWSFDPMEIPQPKTGAGRSGSLFMFSQDCKYLFKTIPKHEFESLIAVLPPYKTHLRNNPASRLMRFYNLHQFRRKGRDSIYLIVANNIFYNQLHLQIDMKYDLKGRVVKKSSRKKKGYLDKPAAGGVWKDNQLQSRTFSPVNTPELLAMLRVDALFLREQECIDYSLLVGIHNATEKRPANDEANNNTNVGRISGGNASMSLVDTIRLSVETRHGRAYSMIEMDKNIGVGIPSEDNTELYFFGVIDFLSRYFWKKKVANFAKRALWAQETLSTVPPPMYCDRWVNYLKTIIRFKNSAQELQVENMDDSGATKMLSLESDPSQKVGNTKSGPFTVAGNQRSSAGTGKTTTSLQPLSVGGGARVSSRSTNKKAETSSVSSRSVRHDVPPLARTASGPILSLTDNSVPPTATAGGGGAGGAAAAASLHLRARDKLPTNGEGYEMDKGLGRTCEPGSGRHKSSASALPSGVEEGLGRAIVPRRHTTMDAPKGADVAGNVHGEDLTSDNQSIEPLPQRFGLDRTSAEIGLSAMST